MKRKATNLLLYISLVCIGIVTGIAIRHYYNLPLSVDINIIDVATLVATIFLAVYIPEVLDRNFQAIKDKKDIVLQKVEELQFLCRKVNIMVQSEVFTVSKNILIVNNTLDIIQNKLDTLKTLVKIGNLKINFSPELEKIDNLCFEHKKLLWVEENKVMDYNYTMEQQQQEEFLYNQLDHNLCLLIFKIA